MNLLQFLPRRLPGVTASARAKVAIPNRSATLPLVAAAIVVLTLAAAAFFLVRPASAEDVWSATLNVQRLTTNVYGCQTPHDLAATFCSDDDLIVNGVTYAVTQILVEDSKELSLRVNPAPAGTDFDALQIHLDSTVFAIADAASRTHSAGISYTWPTTLSWSAGDEIDVRIALAPPDPPKNLNARADAPIRVKLNWSPVRGSSGYKIEWSADGNDPWALLYDWPPNYGVHTADNTITPGTTRHYRVRAVNAAGESDPSNVVSATTPTLVDSDGGQFNFGAVRSEFESLRDQKVFQYNFEAGEKYLFTIRGRAFKHRVIVTDPGGAEIENFALAEHHFDPRITANQTGLHQVKISHGGATGLTAGDDHSLAAGWFTFHLVPATDEEDITLELTGGARSIKEAAVLNTWLDVDRFNIVVQTGKAYTVRVIGHERTNGEASTPWISRAQFPLSNGGYSENNMALPWVEGQTKQVKWTGTSDLANNYEFQAFVIDLRGHGQHGAEKTWRIYVTSTQRPGTYPYDLGGYEVELKEINPRNRHLPLRAWFVSPPEQHDGKKRVKVQVEFTEAIEESPENVGEHGVQVEGGRVTSVRQVGNQPAGGAAGRSSDGQEDGPEDGEQVWEFEIEPDSDDDLTIQIDGGDSCDEPGAICTADGRSLYKGISTTVEGPKGPLTAAFERLPETHDGEEAAFPFRVAFSEHIQPLRHASFTVDGGEGDGYAPGGRTPRPVANHGRARLGRRRDDHAAGRPRVRHGRCGVHQRERPDSADEQPVGDRRLGFEHGSDRDTGDQRDPAGWRDADGGHLGHRRRGWAGERLLQLPVVGQRRNYGDSHHGWDGLHLHPGRCRRRQGHQSAGQLHRRRRQLGEAEQRGHGRSGGSYPAQQSGHGRTDDQRHCPSWRDPHG